MQENHDNKPARAALYMRKSGKRGDTSVALQVAACEKFLRKNNLTCSDEHWFSDTVHIDTIPGNRPGFRALLSAARNNEFDVVVVYDLYRIARNIQLRLFVFEEFDRLGVALVSTIKEIDTRTQAGRQWVASLSESVHQTYGEKVPGNMHEIVSATTG